MPSKKQFKRCFSIPREPNTALTPGQHVEHDPRAKRVVLTDLYVENRGGGNAAVEILEQRLPESFEVRYVYHTKPGQVLSINFSTGLRLGDEHPIDGVVRVQNSVNSIASVLVRVNGQVLK